MDILELTERAVELASRDEKLFLKNSLSRCTVVIFCSGIQRKDNHERCGV
jgi:hypothetical protein